MPEDVDRLAGLVRSRPGLVEGPVQLAQLVIEQRLHLRAEVLDFRGSPSGPADDHAIDLQSVSPTASRTAAESGRIFSHAVPPGVVVAGREDLRPRQSIKPGQVGLELAMIPGHRQVAGQKHQVIRADGVSPVGLDPLRMVPPPRRVPLSPLGAGERQMQIGNGPDVHGCGSVLQRRTGPKSARTYVGTGRSRG